MSFVHDQNTHAQLPKQHQTVAAPTSAATSATASAVPAGEATGEQTEAEKRRELQAIWRDVALLRDNVRVLGRDEALRDAWNEDHEPLVNDPRRLVFYVDASCMVDGPAASGLAICFQPHLWGRGKDVPWIGWGRRIFPHWHEEPFQAAAIELMAIRTALEAAYLIPNPGHLKTVVVYSDALQVLQRISLFSPDNPRFMSSRDRPELALIADLCDNLKTKYGVDLEFRWVPGHEKAKGRPSWWRSGPGPVLGNRKAHEGARWAARTGIERLAENSRLAGTYEWVQIPSAVLEES